MKRVLSGLFDVFGRARRHLSGNVSPPEEKQHTYATYSEACLGGSYEDPDIVNRVSRATRALWEARDQVDPSPYAKRDCIAVARAAGDGAINVLDLGGACGATFIEVDRAMPGKIESWTVIETPVMQRAGAALALSRRLRFSDRIEVAGKGIEKHLFIAKGVIQFLPDPETTLRNLFSQGAPHVYVSRTPYIDGLETILWTRHRTSIRNHGPQFLRDAFQEKEVSMPMALLPQSLLTIIPAHHGYEPLLQFEEEPDQFMDIGNSRLRLVARGFLWRRL